MQNDTPADVIRFDDFEADLRTGELRRHGRNLRLPHQSFVVLTSLVARPGELVTRDELRARLWPPDTTVEFEQGLNAVVNRLRDALGDSAAKPRFIETLPRRGYRFIGRLEPTPAATGAPAEADPRAVPAGAPAPPQAAFVGRWWRSAAVPIVAAFGLMLYALGAGTPDHADPLASLASSDLRPVTTFEGEEVAPALSPDGARVAFAWKRPTDAGFDLYVGDFTSSAPLRLTRRPARWISAAWSPDGAQLAFLRSSDVDGGLFLVAAIGGTERRLADVAASEPLAQVSWSSDGVRIAYAVTDASGSSTVQILSSRDLSIEPVPVDASCRDAGLPAFSADGSILAFVCVTSVAVYRIEIMDLDRGTTRSLDSMQGYPRGLAWSPDGHSLIVANDAGDGGRLWRVPLDGVPARLPFGEDGSAPAIASASGRMVYVRSRRDIDIRLVHLDAGASAAGRVLSSQRVFVSSRVDIMPRLSPDGSLGAFQSNRTGANEIWVGRIDDGDVTRLTSFEGPLVGGPDWCRDGKRLAFDARATGASAIYIATLGEGMPRRLETNEANLSLPAWSSDCRWIVASDGKGSLYRIAAEGGPAARVTEQPSYYAQVSGTRVVFNVKQTGGVRLWSRPIEGGDEAPLAGMPLLRYDEPWAVSDAGVFFVQTTDGRPSVQFYDWMGPSPRHIGWLAEQPLPLGGLGLSVSTDGRTLLFAHEARSESDVMVADPR